MPLIVNPFEDDAVREPRAVGYSVAGIQRGQPFASGF